MKRLIAGVVVAATMAFGGYIGMSSAHASITCENNGGNTPQGNCNGNGLSHVNPTGFAPPGQNK